MIKVIEKKKTGKKSKPYYSLRYNYMIGDADGYTSNKCKVSIDNPFLERYVNVLNEIEPTKGTWGFCLDMSSLEDAFNEGQITEDDYLFLLRTMFTENLDGDDEYEKKAIEYFTSDSDNKFADEFFEGVDSDAEYSFLVFEGCDIRYVDEYGEKFDCEIV